MTDENPKSSKKISMKWVRVFLLIGALLFVLGGATRYDLFTYLGFYLIGSGITAYYFLKEDDRE